MPRAPSRTIPFTPEPLRGRAAIRQDISDFFRGFPDLRAEIPLLVEDGRQAAIELRFAGTHDGPLPSPSGEIAPTHKRLELQGAVFFALDDRGLIAEERRYYDSAAYLRQLGLGAGASAEAPAH